MVQFSPFKSFVDASFFARLSSYKLEEARLSEQAVAVNGTTSIPLQLGRPAAVRLSSESFDPAVNTESSNTLEYLVPGSIVNLNTLQSFKSLDKAALIREEAMRMAERIRAGEALKDPSFLLHFFVIAFSDLKKYKYYYWFAFPSFSWRSKAVAHPGLGPSAKLNEAIALWSQHTSESAFFSIARADAGTAWSIGVLGDLQTSTTVPLVGLADFASTEHFLPWQLRNLAVLLASTGFKQAAVYIYRDHPRVQGPVLKSYWLLVDLVNTIDDIAGVIGWERNSQNKLAPKITDLAALSDPNMLADQAVDLNLKLMKWRAAPEIDLDILRNSKCLLLGAGTLGCYVARGLMAWGVRHIDFVDNGTVSYSNPVRQPLYTVDDCKIHAPKAEAAAATLKGVFPGVHSHGYNLSIPMAGHPVNDEAAEKKHYEKLVDLVESSDAVFLLMDSRESRWLPTVICEAKQKLVINTAIGFDSFLVMRHGISCAGASGTALGCYYCNDVVAPLDSTTGLTLDQMCTVTRPGVAQLASGYAVELFATVMQHKMRQFAPADGETVLGPASHQLRGFLRKREVLPVRGNNFVHCSGCGTSVLGAWETQGWEFVQRALNDPAYLTELSGLGELQRLTEDLDFESSDGQFE